MIREKLSPHAEDAKMLLCGPPPMMTAMKKSLDELKWPAPRTVSKMGDSIFLCVLFLPPSRLAFNVLTRILAPTASKQPDCIERKGVWRVHCDRQSWKGRKGVLSEK